MKTQDLIVLDHIKSNLSKPTNRKNYHNDHYYRSKSRSRNKPTQYYRNRQENGKKKPYSVSSSSSSSSSSQSNSSSSNSSRSYSESRSGSNESSKSIKIIKSGSTEKRRNTQHYRYQVGEKIGHKYRIIEVFGDGTFGRVLKGEYQKKKYAIKVIKPVEKYIKSAKIEKNIVKEINQNDKNDTHGIVRFIEAFQHHRHYCLVFNELGSSLYHVIKKNHYKGFSKKLIKSFFYQILKSVGYIHKLGYTHTDLKPENILFQKNDFEKRVNYRGISKYYYPLYDKIRIIDFGSATKDDEHHSSIINTRQYRSPQVILQCCRWNEISDVWSIGCIIVQLYTGNLLFDTHQNYEHLAMIQKNSGRFPSWMIDDCKNKLKNMFGHGGQIRQSQIRRYVGEGENIIYMKTVDEIFQDDLLLRKLLGKCLQIDPNRRISCQQALKDDYFKS